MFKSNVFPRKYIRFNVAGQHFNENQVYVVWVLLISFPKNYIEFFKGSLNRTSFCSFNDPNQTTTAGFEKAV